MTKEEFMRLHWKDGPKTFSVLNERLEVLNMCLETIKKINKKQCTNL